MNPSLRGLGWIWEAPSPHGAGEQTDAPAPYRSQWWAAPGASCGSCSNSESSCPAPSASTELGMVVIRLPAFPVCWEPMPGSASAPQGLLRRSGCWLGACPPCAGHGCCRRPCPPYAPGPCLPSVSPSPLQLTQGPGTGREEGEAWEEGCPGTGNGGYREGKRNGCWAGTMGTHGAAGAMGRTVTVPEIAQALLLSGRSPFLSPNSGSGPSLTCW